MLAQLCLTLKPESGDITYRKSSRLQGVLMEQISEKYAEKLHEQSVHPYSQYVTAESDGTISWYVSTLNEEAYHQIIEPLQSPLFSSFQFSNGLRITIQRKRLIKRFEEELLEASQEGSNAIRLSFRTPTAFRQKGAYTLFPEPILLYQSLLIRMNTVSDLPIAGGEEAISYLAEKSLVSQYSLKTMLFPEERVNIPGFMGGLAIHFTGNKEERAMASYLFRFGTFSGIGVKTGMGMGALRME